MKESEVRRKSLMLILSVLSYHATTSLKLLTHLVRQRAHREEQPLLGGDDLGSFEDLLDSLETLRRGHPDLVALRLGHLHKLARTSPPLAVFA